MPVHGKVPDGWEVRLRQPIFETTMKCRTLFLSLLLLLPLAGCRQNHAVTGDGRIPLRVFLLLISTKQVAFYQWAEQEYERLNPNVDLIIEQFPGTSLKDFEIKIRLRYASGQAPDIWYHREDLLSEFVNLGLVDPAPEYIAKLVRENSLNEMVRDASFFDGRCYGIAHSAAWTALYYNKQMFREAGLDPERPPQTWDELIDYADRLTIRRPDGSIARAGFSLRKAGYKRGTAEKFLTFFYTAGGRVFNAEGTKSNFDTPAGRAALSFYKTILDRRIDSVEFEGDQQGFGQGRVAMFIRELHVVDWLRTNYPDLGFGVAPIPSFEAGEPSYSSGGAYPFVVSSDSKYKDEAWRFLEFLMQDGPYARYMRTVGELPMLKSVAEQPEFSDDPARRVFIEQPVRASPKLPYDKRSMEIIGAYIERFAYGHLTLDETLRRMTNDVDAHVQTNYARYERGRDEPAEAVGVLGSD